MKIPRRKTNNREIKSDSVVSPSEFMRARHPNLFSDSKVNLSLKMPQSVFEYFLDTLTNKKLENQFEYFCRRLAEKELCPNLLPQTGPVGGGDSQVDSETYPVSDQIAASWYQGIGQEASYERWAFAFSAKKTWRPKVESDIEKIVNSNRGYKLAYFITNQFVRDRKRAEVEDLLKTKYGIEVRILDRSWIVKCVFEHDHLQLAIETLNIPGYEELSRKLSGPEDTRRQIELQEIEKNLENPDRYRGVKYQYAEDCLQAALCARGLELPRTEVEGRFQRAKRIADEVGLKQQKLRVIYNYAWTEYWWYEDYHQFNYLYADVEKLAIGSEQADDIELLCNLWQILHAATRRGFIGEDEGSLTDRTETLKSELDRAIKGTHRPNNSLLARSNLLLLNLAEAISQKKPIDPILDGLKNLLEESRGLAQFSVLTITRIIQELGDFLIDSPKYDELLELVIKVTEQRSSEGGAGQILLRCGIQKFKSGKNYDTIKLIGRAQQKLALDEYKADWITSIAVCGLAYEAVGLIWAARANFLLAANIAFTEYIKSGTLNPSTLKYFQKLIGLELKLGRLPNILNWIEASTILTNGLVLEEDVEEKFLDQHDRQDQVLAILLLKTDFLNLKWLDFLPFVLESMGLYHSWMTLLYALGYENFLRSEKIIPPEESEDTIHDLFLNLSNHPASADLPDQPDFIQGPSVELASYVLGCNVRIKTPTNLTSIFLAETIFGALEAFLATSFDSNILPYRSELKITIEPSNNLTDIPEYKINEFKQGEITLRHPAQMKKDSQEERISFRIWLKKLIIDISLELFVAPNADSFFEQIIKKELSLDRALFLSDSEIAINNILGQNPKFRLSDWQNEIQEKKYPLLREVPWNYGIENSLRESAEKKPIKFSEGEPPESFFDMDRLRHNDRQVLSLINIPLWDKAQWIGTAYLCLEGSIPILALCFNNRDSAEQIFKEWGEILGEIDEEDKLRLSIITGVNKREPLNYRVLVSTNLEVFNKSKKNFFIFTSRCNEMYPQTHEYLNTFFADYEKTGMYVLAPASLNPETSSIELIGNVRIGKHKLFLRPAWQIGDNDPDVIAIHESDEPIIPKGESAPPIIQALKRFDRGRNRKRHK